MDISEMQKSYFWLFPDMLIGETMFEITDFKAEYKTNKGKVIPVFVLTGNARKKDGKELIGDFLATAWNLNLLKCIEAWGTNTDDYINKKILVKADGAKILCVPAQ